MSKILIVDDNEDVREIVSEIVRSIDQEPVLASGGLEGLRLAEEVMPDLVILDINMPDMDGWNVLRRMKEDGLTDHMKVMMLTATADIGADIFGLQDVIYGYIRKPFDNTELAERLLEAIDGKAESALLTKLSRDMMVRAGYSYVVRERKPIRSYDMFVDVVASGVQGLCVSRDHPQLIRQQYDLETVPIIWLSNKLGKAYVNPANIGILKDTIVRFVEKADDSVVLINGIEFLMVNNDFNKVIRMVHHVTEAVMEKRSRLIISVDPRALDSREMALLERNMEVVDAGDNAPVKYI